MIDLYVFNQNLDLLSEVSEYIDLELERRYDTYSQIVLNVQADDNTLTNLKIGNIITTQSNPRYGYIIEHVRYSHDGPETLEIVAFSLNFLLTFRSIYPQQVFNGNHENAIRYFVRNNAINPSNTRRVIPRLALGQVNNIGTSGNTFIKTGGDLLEWTMAIANSVGATVDIVINHTNKMFELIVDKGVNRSARQTANPVVVFSEEYDNILSQSYFLSYIDYKNSPVIAGEGEDIARNVVDLSTNTGTNRRELYVDARDLQSTYRDDNDNEVTLSPQDYTSALISRGEEALLETPITETFEANVDETQFIYGVDYFIGDTVSVRNDRLGLMLDVPVSSVIIFADSTGTTITPSLGTALSNIYKIGGK